MNAAASGAEAAAEAGGPAPDSLDALARAVGRWLAAHGAHAGNVLAIARLETRLFARLLIVTGALAVLALLLAGVLIAGAALLATAALASVSGNPWLAAIGVLAGLALALALTVHTVLRYAQHMQFAVTRDALGLNAGSGEPQASTPAAADDPQAEAPCH